MARTLIVVAAFLSLAVPADLAAPPAEKGKPESPGKSAAAPGQSAEKNAAKWCKAERAKLGAADFKKLYAPTNHPNGANAFGKCVSAKVKKAGKEAEAKEAKENAAKACKAERAKLGAEEFKKQYASPNHPTGANAFGKCVSKLAKSKSSS
jgi:hypothetical protein